MNALGPADDSRLTTKRSYPGKECQGGGLRASGRSDQVGDFDPSDGRSETDAKCSQGSSLVPSPRPKSPPSLCLLSDWKLPLAPEPYQKLFQQGVQTAGDSVLVDPNKRTVKPAR